MQLHFENSSYSTVLYIIQNYSSCLMPLPFPLTFPNLLSSTSSPGIGNFYFIVYFSEVKFSVSVYKGEHVALDFYTWIILLNRMSANSTYIFENDRIHALLWWVAVLCTYILHILSQISVSEYLETIYILDMSADVSLNTHFISFGCIVRKGIPRPSGRSITNFLRTSVYIL